MLDKKLTTSYAVHQPWASLLVAGIKRVEGRTWSAGDFHGCLFIHAAAAPPDPAAIAQVLPALACQG